MSRDASAISASLLDHCHFANCQIELFDSSSDGLSDSETGKGQTHSNRARTEKSNIQIQSE